MSTIDPERLLPDSTAEQLAAEFRDAQEYFRTGTTKALRWRAEQLRAAKKMVTENGDAIVAALNKDLRRPRFEALIYDTVAVLSDIDVLLEGLPAWAAPVEVNTPLLLKPASSKIVKDPKGVVLVLGAWNFPVQLSLMPAMAAIAAGNTVIIKPSEVSPTSASLISQLIRKYMDPHAVKVVLGGIDQSTALLDMRFNHIFYTGGTAVGSVVMAAAAKRLTPVTLELGGKSPVIVAKDANIDVAARRILGDYVLVEAAVEGKLLEALTSTLSKFYGESPQASRDLGRIVNRRHFDRLSALLSSHRGEVVVGGATDPTDLYIAPTILRGVDTNSPVMKDEIFGPILPVISVRTVEDAITFVNDRPQPLALYIFSSSKATQEKVLSATTSGGVCINDTVYHAGNPSLPFGGIGPSGLGSYHGKFGFDAFSHSKAVLSAPTWSYPALRYPPYSPQALKIVSFLATFKLRMPGGKLGGLALLLVLMYLLSKLVARRR